MGTIIKIKGSNSKLCNVEKDEFIPKSNKHK